MVSQAISQIGIFFFEEKRAKLLTCLMHQFGPPQERAR